MARHSTARTAGRLANHGFWILVLLGLLLVFRIVALRYGATDLFFDEAQYWTWSETPAFGYFSKPPLIAWLIGLSTSLCGLSEFCIRVPAPLIHTGTALLIFWLGRRVYNSQVGFWSALTFATLPGISLSSSIISTDVPLLFGWALALIAFVELAGLGAADLQHPSDDVVPRKRPWWPALLLGVALGIGLNAKYAMIFFVICAAIYVAVTPSRRWLARDPRAYVALLIGFSMIVPNILWNLEHGFATLTHTASNANWSGPLLQPQKALEFFVSQFGVFGPILFAGLLILAWRSWRQGLNDADWFMAMFCAPVLTVITVQSFLSRAHANWAATAYIAGTLLVTATLIRRTEWRWLKSSLAIHLAVLIALGIGGWQAGKFDWPGTRDPFARVLGWKEVASVTRGILNAARKSGRPYGGLITDDRSVSAELLYYMRIEQTPLWAWLPSGLTPRNHYELTRPFRGTLEGPFLLVSKIPSFKIISRNFKNAELIAKHKIPAGSGKPRLISYYRLSGYTKLGSNLARMKCWHC